MTYAQLSELFQLRYGELVPKDPKLLNVEVMTYKMIY